MNAKELKHYQRELEKAAAELRESLRHRHDIRVERLPDDLDQTVLAADREWAVRELDRASKSLRAIEAALARIKDGTFGECLHCEVAIAPKRLQALPWAAYCVPCQELADSNQEQGNEMWSPSIEAA